MCRRWRSVRLQLLAADRLALRLFANLEWYAFLWIWLAILVGTVYTVWAGAVPRVVWLLAFPPVALELLITATSTC